LPRLGSRVRISSPAPNSSEISRAWHGGLRVAANAFAPRYHRDTTIPFSVDAAIRRQRSTGASRPVRAQAIEVEAARLRDGATPGPPKAEVTGSNPVGCAKFHLSLNILSGFVIPEQEGELSAEAPRKRLCQVHRFSALALQRSGSRVPISHPLQITRHNGHIPRYGETRLWQFELDKTKQHGGPDLGRAHTSCEWDQLSG
jgi:hypothetical protein